jgi:UDP-galactopyranose mutase
VDGYTAVIEKLVDHKNISISLNKKFDPSTDVSGYDHVFYTGPIDAYFDYKYGRLGYRTVTFEAHYADGDYQGVTQMNYCDADVPYTRIAEPKHFTYWEQHDKTIYFKEFSKETTPSDIPYYPKRVAADKTLLLQYRSDAEQLQNVSFLGRLATYRYMDMHHVIGEALQYAQSFLDALSSNSKAPVFPNTEV